MRIQVREDGVQFDQIVLSPRAYLTTAPGPVSADHTIVRKPETPFTGTPFTVPGTFQAEDFDRGGEGVAYHDNVPGNAGRQYRTTEDVDIVAAAGNASGYVVNNFETGEWLKYTINATSAGTYTIALKVSSEYSTSLFHVDVDGVNVSGSVAVPATGSWGTFQLVSVHGVNLSAGTHVLRVYCENQYFNFDAIQLLY
jgi:hypothetical protein